MKYDISVATVAPRKLAAVRGQARLGEIGTVAMPALDKVYAFLSTRQDLQQPSSHNLFLYHHPANRSDPMTIDFGVEVASAFAAEGGVVCVETPAGQAARTLYVGPYSQMHPAHQAIHQWCAKNGKRIGGISWEVYGDWTEDESKLETEIFYLLV
ncbi:MAG: GyrI-like domain-containing protein [Terricaulis sp.]